jgi:hypothetical protein
LSFQVAVIGMPMRQLLGSPEAIAQQAGNLVGLL